jgi:hypothetical protein
MAKRARPTLKKLSWRQRENIAWAARLGSGSSRVVTIWVW